MQQTHLTSSAAGPSGHRRISVTTARHSAPHRRRGIAVGAGEPAKRNIRCKSHCQFCDLCCCCCCCTSCGYGSLQSNAVLAHAAASVGCFKLLSCRTGMLPPILRQPPSYLHLLQKQSALLVYTLRCSTSPKVRIHNIWHSWFRG